MIRQKDGAYNYIDESSDSSTKYHLGILYSGKEVVLWLRFSFLLTAAGAAAAGIILVSKVDPEDAKDTLVSISDAVVKNLTRLSDGSEC